MVLNSNCYIYTGFINLHYFWQIMGFSIATPWANQELRDCNMA